MCRCIRDVFTFSALLKDIFLDSQLPASQSNCRLYVQSSLSCSAVCQGHSHKGIYQWEIKMIYGVSSTTDTKDMVPCGHEPHGTRQASLNPCHFSVFFFVSPYFFVTLFFFISLSSSVSSSPLSLLSFARLTEHKVSKQQMESLQH